MHDALTVGIPLLAILAGILFNRWDAQQLRGEISTLRTDISTSIDGLRIETRESIDGLRTETRGLIDGLRTETRGSIDGLRNSIDADLRILNGIAYDHAQRLTRLEKTG